MKKTIIGVAIVVALVAVALFLPSCAEKDPASSGPDGDVSSRPQDMYEFGRLVFRAAKEKDPAAVILLSEYVEEDIADGVFRNAVGDMLRKRKSAAVSAFLSENTQFSQKNRAVLVSKLSKGELSRFLELERKKLASVISQKSAGDARPIWQQWNERHVLRSRQQRGPWPRRPGRAERGALFPQPHPRQAQGHDRPAAHDHMKRRGGPQEHPRTAETFADERLDTQKNQDEGDPFGLEAANDPFACHVASLEQTHEQGGSEDRNPSTRHHREAQSAPSPGQ